MEFNIQQINSPYKAVSFSTRGHSGFEYTYYCDKLIMKHFGNYWNYDKIEKKNRQEMA